MIRIVRFAFVIACFAAGAFLHGAGLRANVVAIAVLALIWGSCEIAHARRRRSDTTRA